MPAAAGTAGEISFPIVRDMDTFCYERQHGGDMEVGSYAHRAILHDPDDIPSIEQAKLSPTELPFTADDFDQQLEQALELMPELLGDRRRRDPLRHQRPAVADAGRHPDPRRDARGQGPVVGRRGLDQGRPGRRPAVAEWMTDGNPEIDLHHSDIARFYPHQRTEHHVAARTSEAFNKTYGIVHPREQCESATATCGCAPMHASREGARRRVLRDRRLGAAALVRVQRRRCSRSTATP